MIQKIKFLIIIISFNISAQQSYETKVTYTENLNFDIQAKKTSELFFNNIRSYYVEKNEIRNYDKKNVKVIEYGKRNHKIINIDFEKDSIFTNTSFNKKFFLIGERISQISWNIDKKSNNTILGFKSKKATGYFRGRTYTAWFTEEIPTRFGPWKLHGLPGLILEVQDNLNQVQFIAERIEYIKKSELDFKFFLNNKGNYERVSLKEYRKKLDIEIEVKIQQIISKLPKGSKIINMKNRSHKGLELKYEWEEKE